MNHKVLLNKLQLSYSPLCNRDFTILREDKDIQRAIEESSIYIIAQRPVIRFDNVRTNDNSLVLEFDIRQEGNASVLKCKLPIFQEHIATDPNMGVDLYVGSNDGRTLLPKDFPVSNIHGVKILEVDPDDETKNVFSFGLHLKNFFTIIGVA